MAAEKRKKKTRKKVKYRKITITVSARQKKSLEKFCKSRKTTPTKVIKKAIRPLLENYAALDVRLSKQKFSQLELFGDELSSDP